MFAKTSKDADSFAILIRVLIVSKHTTILISLLEVLVLENEHFSKNKNLQTLFMVTLAKVLLPYLSDRLMIAASGILSSN